MKKHKLYLKGKRGSLFPFGFNYWFKVAPSTANTLNYFKETAMQILLTTALIAQQWR
jgi:hypothetical protein